MYGREYRPPDRIPFDKDNLSLKSTVLETRESRLPAVGARSSTSSGDGRETPRGFGAKRAFAEEDRPREKGCW